MANLKEATNDRRRSTRASKPPSSDNKFTTTATTSSAISHSQPSAVVPGQTSAVVVPGLTSITPEQVAGMAPTFDHNRYTIADPQNFPEGAPQTAEGQHNRNQTIGAGMMRSLKDEGLAQDVRRENFIVLGKYAKAFGAGIQTATEFEKVKGTYADYLSQREVTSQKEIKLDIQRVTTVTELNTGVYTKEELAQRQELGRLKTETIKSQVSESQNKLAEFQKSLGFATAR